MVFLRICVAVLVSAAWSRKSFNILSIDGGGIRGIIPAKAIKNMEEFAYYYVTQKAYSKWKPYYTTEDKDGVPKGTLIQRMPMKDIFDMFAGTSTGSILATAMSVPKVVGGRDPRFWADDALDIYMKGGVIIFKQNEFGAWLYVLTYSFYIIFMSALFYLIGKCVYQNPEKIKALDEIHKFLTDIKQSKLKVEIMEGLNENIK